MISNIDTAIFHINLAYLAQHFGGTFNKYELTMRLPLICSPMKQIMPKV